MKQYLLGVDNGGTLARAALCDASGREIAVVSYPTRLLTPAPGQTERDLTEFWEATARCIREVIQKAGIQPAEIACVACCGHGKGLYLIDGDGKPLANGIISTDTRAHEYLTLWEQDGTAEKIREWTCQSILVSQPCALLRWMKDHRPEVYEKIGTVLEAKDYIRYCLTGEAYGEMTDFSGTNLVNLHTRSYDARLFEAFGIPEMADKMPPLRSALDLCGRITREAAALCGLQAGTPVAGGMFDIDACALASGVTDAENLCVIAGTWSINEYISSVPVTDGTVAMNSIFCMPEYYLIEESSPTSAGNLAWLAKNVFNTDKQEAARQGHSIYQVFDTLAEAVDPATDLYYLPYIFGSQDHPCARGAFIGMNAQTTKAQMIRAVLEGVVFNHRMHVDKLLESRKDHPPRCIRLAGGAAHSTLWVQMFADILGLPIETILSDELGTLGCAINGAVTCGLYASLKEAAAHMVHVGDTVLPDPQKFAEYERKYRIFTQMVQVLHPVWDAIGTGN